MRMPCARTARCIVALATVSLLAGCGWINRVFQREGASRKAGEPAALTRFEPSAEADRLWSHSLGKGENKLWLRQPPAVAEGRVYAADVGGSAWAFAAESGKVLWRSKTDYRFATPPGVGAGFVVAGTLDGEVVALNADTGEERWQVKVLSEITAAPLIGGGLAVIRAADGRVFGLDLADGQRKWVYTRGLPSLTVRGTGAPVAGPDVAYVGYDDGTVVALRLTDGSPAWEQTVIEPEGRTELERMADIDGELAVGVNALYAASFKGRLSALDQASGRPLWNRDLATHTGVAIAGDRVVATDNEGNVWALDRNTGGALWRQDAFNLRWLTTPAIQGDYVVVGDLDGYVHWLRLDTGEIAAREHAGGDPIRATPQVSADRVAYVVTTDGKLSAYRIAPR